MTDDRGKRTITALEDFRRAATAGARQAIPIHREDDTVPLGRPPGVPRTVTADLGQQAAAALRALFATFTSNMLHLTIDAQAGVVTFDASGLLSARDVEKLLERVAGETTRHPSALSELEAAVLAAMTPEWLPFDAIAALAHLDGSDAVRALRGLRDRGLVIGVGGEWRRK